MEQLLGKQFGLSPQQVKNIMEKSRHHDNNNNNNNNNYQDAHTFHRILNRLVYIISFSALIYVLNRDYNNFASFWFAYYFPKEATTLGMFVPQSKGR
mmetsp:Transcript_2416/g.3446  ORF Transcript_2416/g.3446 Transcript_2416/m.3446 type:complete len:97 (-) Transcript_2416:66-356(-)